ncbi:conserved hypothetical protein [Histoplasma capsulatum var. duboisii H88]|uniref:Uncharacterized protein n=1 Tax=Ajellomyces capsulatus (strain H88) TaxID=544711 RepID=F0U6I7_AJEC8|nr:conserved hypothetical protein [Histoplasma capsulatum var. duboisii H88]QSS51278.1 hypothetical protein I7I53_06556 [Histoplasma capsulatum var. duboisii H88]
MTGKLTLHKSPKRKRDGIDYQQRTTSSSPASSHTSISVKDGGHLSDECSPAVGGNSPQISVVGELGELDLHGTSSHRFVESTDNGAADYKQTINQGDEVPSEQGLMNIDASPTVTSITTKDTEEITRALLGDGGLRIMSPVPVSQQKPKPNSQQKPMSRRKSPPLSSNEDENPLTWHDSEITGYAPTDPNDDGYGINGVGFKPTAAVAWDRSQRRQKQVAEWKSREAKEARERRKSRRDGILLNEHAENTGHNYKKVKFDISTEN